MTDTLGAVLAGGASTRFGSPKALARVGGKRVVDRVTGAIAAVIPRYNVVAIVNDPELAAAIGLPHRPDLLRGIGPLAGVHAALRWADERGMAGVLAAACDLPFLSPGLLHELISRRKQADIVIPESPGRRGVEPLCAWYGTACTAAIERAVERGDQRMIGFHADVRVERVPLEVVRSFGDPERMFSNLNTPQDAAAAERAAAERA